jgi:ADP-heptose:LPS heptosyltransferase
MLTNQRLGEKPPENIAILRALQLGDLLCAVPAFRALRAALPGSQITMIGLPWAHSFAARFSKYFDDFITLPGYPGLSEISPQIEQLPSFLSQVQWINFDLAIQMHGSGIITNPLVAMLGAKKSTGFYLPGQFCPDEERFLAYPVHEHEIRKHLRLMEHIGVMPQGENLEFPIFEKDRFEYNALERQYHLQPGRYAIIHPGARASERRWPPEHFAGVGNGLAERGLRVILTGTFEESELTKTVAAMMKYPALDLAGQTSLGSLAVLLTNARLLVSNDTGVSHVAAALQIPSVVMFLSSDPNRWAPLNQNLHRAIAWASAATPEVVLDEVENLLLEERVYAS